MRERAAELAHHGPEHQLVERSMRTECLLKVSSLPQLEHDGDGVARGEPITPASNVLVRAHLFQDQALPVEDSDCSRPAVAGHRGAEGKLEGPPRAVRGKRLEDKRGGSFAQGRAQPETVAEAAAVDATQLGDGG
eukprot:scaffold116433_cov28-Tisochrysis_lutea.AAC.2